ncbi:MAG: hypothetical protein HAW64_05055 [Alphaproteobacteria bacterium]|nr:hypothetical protein [Alphaproteobacteria bacterium]
MRRCVRVRRWWRGTATFDNALDLSVDLALVFLDAFTTPILLPIRIGKFFLKKGIKKVVMGVRHRFSA